MKKTPEQAEAYAELTRAVEKVIAVESPDFRGVTMEYVIVAATIEYDNEGDPDHSFFNLYRDGSVALTRALGLLDASRSTLMRTERA